MDICAKGQSKHIDQHRQKMGMVFQQFNLFNNMNVMKNLTAGPVRIKGMDRAEAEAKALELLGRVGLADRAERIPQPALRRAEAAHSHCAFADAWIPR